MGGSVDRKVLSQPPASRAASPALAGLSGRAGDELFEMLVKWHDHIGGKGKGGGFQLYRSPVPSAEELKVLTREEVCAPGPAAAAGRGR